MSHIALFIATIAGFSAAIIPVTVGLLHQARDHRSRAASSDL